MADIEKIDIYYPPEPIEANLVGQVEVCRSDSGNMIHMTFLRKSFGKDIFITGKFLSEQRTRWAAKRACSRVLFQAELQLEADLPGHMPSDPDAIAF